MSDTANDTTGRFRFEREAGRILFGDERFLLFSGEAVAKLRSELYEVLGPIMAHEILFRFGFHDGTRAARAARAARPAVEPVDLLGDGPGLHSLEGIVHADRGEVETDDAGNFLRMTGVWDDSFEADQVLAEWGTVEWTACWILTGFASGFASEILGRDALCVERACRARGDAACRYEVLPAEPFPGLARKVRALREGRRMRERMQTTLTRISEQAYTSSAFLSRILRDSADAILTVDEAEVIRSWNRGAEQLLGYAADEVIGRHFSFLVPPDLLERAEIDTIRRETQAKGSLRNYETRRLRKDGEEVHVSLTRTAIHDAHGRYVGCSAILRDITERTKLVEQLIQAESLAEIGELAAQVAHEIKNPLAGISAAVQLLAETVAEDDPRRGVFLEVLDHIRRLDETVLSLLRFTRPYVPDLRPAEVEDLLSSALGVLTATEEFRDVEVRREIAGDTGRVRVDAQQFIQVLMNLLLNAAQALREDRRITVRAGRDDGTAFIEIEDRGVGIPPNLRKQIFRPFYTSRNQGTGLGLPIAKKIVEGHGGTIEVDSEPGRGSRFRIRLPAAE